MFSTVRTVGRNSNWKILHGFKQLPFMDMPLEGNNDRKEVRSELDGNMREMRFPKVGDRERKKCIKEG